MEDAFEFVREGFKYKKYLFDPVQFLTHHWIKVF